eukprot:1985585-Heterocapsa_arctica.AAC.1
MPALDWLRVRWEARRQRASLIHLGTGEVYDLPSGEMWILHADEEGDCFIRSGGQSKWCDDLLKDVMRPCPKAEDHWRVYDHKKDEVVSLQAYRQKHLYGWMM